MCTVDSNWDAIWDICIVQMIAGCMSVDGRLCDYGYSVSQLPVIWEWGVGIGDGVLFFGC